MGLCHSVASWRCICKKDLYIASVVRHPGQSIVNDFGVGLLTWERCGCRHYWRGRSGIHYVLCVRLLVWKAGPSLTEAVSMLMEFPVGETNLERQSAALFLAPEIHSKVIL